MKPRVKQRKTKVKSAKELIEKGDVAQKEPGKKDDRLDISPISEKGKEKREKNLS